jgi:hypothetical protein
MEIWMKVRDMLSLGLITTSRKKQKMGNIREERPAKQAFLAKKYEKNANKIHG